MMAEVKKKKEEEKEEGEEIAIKVEVKEEVTWHSGARKHLSFCIHSHASHTYTSHHSPRSLTLHHDKKRKVLILPKQKLQSSGSTEDLDLETLLATDWGEYC